MHAREQAISLMNQVTSGSLDVSFFCSAYENLYNFDWENRSTEKDMQVFENLFNVVVYFTPYPEEKKSVYPEYKTADEVLHAVHNSLLQLST